jgi:HSP20 family protein
LILSHHGKKWCPPTDVYETHESIAVKVEVAGMAEDDFAITYSDRTLIVAGIRRDPTAKLGYHQMEISYGEFQLTFTYRRQLMRMASKPPIPMGFCW